MADIADVAAQADEILLAAAQTMKKREGPAATGVCLNCGEHLGDGRRWCDADCRDDYEYRMERRLV